MNGILNIYKEPGYTSFDVVAKLRKILKMKKIGHTGTLDPAAEGVLPVCIGKATKLCDLITDKTKTYEAVLRLGITTDTLDMEGSVLSEAEVKCTAEEIAECILSFKGEQKQVPPMYSALKQNGKRLYELARAGITVEREARNITIFDIRILRVELPRVTFRVDCSKGTYIRSLCDDIGKKLGCGGCMEHLTRTATGGFDIENALRLSQVEQLVMENKLEDVILTMDAALSGYPAVHTKPQADKAAENGNKILCEFLENPAGSLNEGQNVRLYDSSGRFIGIYEYIITQGLIKPVKILMV